MLSGLAESLKTFQTLWNQFVGWLQCCLRQAHGVESECEELIQWGQIRVIIWRRVTAAQFVLLRPEAVKRPFGAFVEFSGGDICSASSTKAMASCLLALFPIIRWLARAWPCAYQPSFGELDLFPASVPLCHRSSLQSILAVVPYVPPPTNTHKPLDCAPRSGSYSNSAFVCY